MVYGKSYGVSCTIQEYISIYDSIVLQQLSKRFYNKFISNIIFKVKLVNIYKHLIIHINHQNERSCIIDLKNMTKNKLVVKMKIIKYFAQIMTHDGRFFITGGNERFSLSSSLLYELEIINKKFIPRKSMIDKRSDFPITQLDKNTLVVTGGYNYKCINKCEVYLIREDKWKPIADLNAIRSSHNSFSCNGNTVYVFSGYKSANKFEKIVLDTNYNGVWEGIKVKNESIYNDKYYPQVFKISNSSVYIAGGNDHYNDLCYLYDPTKNEITKSDYKLAKGSYACEYNCVYYRRKMYWIDIYNDIHIFDEHKWTIIDNII